MSHFYYSGNSESPKKAIDASYCFGARVPPKNPDKKFLIMGNKCTRAPNEPRKIILPDQGEKPILLRDLIYKYNCKKDVLFCQPTGKWIFFVGVRSLPDYLVRSVDKIKYLFFIP